MSGELAYCLASLLFCTVIPLECTSTRFRHAKALLRRPSKLRPGKTFAGFTCEQFLAAIKPSYDVRTDIAASELHLQSGRARRVTIDEASLKVVQRIVNAVKADPEEGDDGELFVAASL